MLGRLSYIISAKTDELKSGIGSAKKEMSDADKSMRQSTQSMAQHGKQAGGEIRTDVEKTGGAFGNLGDTIKKIGGALVAAFAARKLYQGVKDLINNLAETADRLLDLSDITGMSTDKLQEYEYVAKMAGVSTEAIASASQNLTNRFQNLYRESSPISRAFRELGIEAHTANGELRATDEIMDDALVSLAEMTNQTERNALAAQIFGGSWKDLAPILSMGKDGIEGLRKEAHDLGIVMSKDAIDAANDYRQEVVRLEASMDVLKRSIGEALIPVLINLTSTLNEARIGARNFKSAVDDMVEFEAMSKSESRLRRWYATFMASQGNMNAVVTQSLKIAEAHTQAQSKMLTEMIKLDGVIGNAVMRGEEENQVIQEAIVRRNELAERLGKEAEWREYLIGLKEQEAEITKDEIETIGLLEGLQAQLAAENEAMMKATDESAIAISINRIRELNEQIEKVKELAETKARYARIEEMGLPGLEPMQPIVSDEVVIANKINLDEMLTDHQSTIDAMNEKTEELSEFWLAAGQQIEQALAEVVGGALQELGRMLATGEADWKDYVGSVLNSISAMLAGLFVQAMLGMLTQEVSKAGLYGLATAAVGMAAIAALWSQYSVGMAEGGVVPAGYPGDSYPAMLTSGETVIPPKKLEQGCGTPAKIEVFARGDQLYGVWQKERQKRGQLI